ASRVQELYKWRMEGRQKRRGLREPQPSQYRRVDRDVCVLGNGRRGCGSGCCEERLQRVAADTGPEARGDLVSGGGNAGAAQGRLFDGYDARDGEGAG